MVNISLETSVHCLSQDVSFAIEVEFTRNLLKCYSDFTKKSRLVATLPRDNVTIAMIALLVAWFLCDLPTYNSVGLAAQLATLGSPI